MDLGTLDPEQLASVQQQLEEEIQSLAQSSLALQKAAGEFGKSGRAVEALAEQKEGERAAACTAQSLRRNSGPACMLPDRSGREHACIPDSCMPCMQARRCCCR